MTPINLVQDSGTLEEVRFIENIDHEFARIDRYDPFNEGWFRETVRRANLVIKESHDLHCTNSHS